jgi:hypothetical protein
MDESIVKFGEHMMEIALGRPILRRNRLVEGSVQCGAAIP